MIKQAEISSFFERCEKLGIKNIWRDSTPDLRCCFLASLFEPDVCHCEGQHLVRSFVSFRLCPAVLVVPRIPYLVVLDKIVLSALFFVKSANCIRGFPRGCKNDIGIGDRLFNYLSKPLMKGGYLDDPALRFKRWLRRFTNRVLYVANGAHCSPHRSVSRFQSRLQLTNSVSGDFDGTRIVIWRGASTAYKLLALSR